jgi:hypothetical protein
MADEMVSQTLYQIENEDTFYYNFSFDFAFTLPFFTFDYLIPLNPGHESSYLWLVSPSLTHVFPLWLI